MDALIVERKPEEKTYDLMSRVDKVLLEQGFFIRTHSPQETRTEDWYECSEGGAIIAQYGNEKFPKIRVQIKNPEIDLEVDGILFFLGVPKEVYLALNSSWKENY